jgi:hypothetical protein
MQEMPGWRELPKRGKRPRLAVKDAETLIEWCQKHHKGIPVKPCYNEQWCNKPKEHPSMWRKMKNLKRWTNSPQAWQYKEAFSLLDEAFPGQWRPGDGGGGPTTQAHSLIKPFA